MEREFIRKTLDSQNNDKANSDLKFLKLVSRLRRNDETLAEVEFCNTIIFTQKPHRFIELFAALYGNKCVIKMDLVNISMKDSDCAVLVEALATCPSLQKLNVESNSLSSVGIELIADMAEKHPSIKELKVSNQRMAVGAEAERALTNCLSQNINITKLSHTFREKFVGVYADKYIRRNLDLQRQKLKASKAGIDDLSDSQVVLTIPPLDPYPFPKRNLSEESKLQAQKLLLDERSKPDLEPTPVLAITESNKLSEKSSSIPSCTSISLPVLPNTTTSSLPKKNHSFFFFMCGSSSDVKS